MTNTHTLTPPVDSSHPTRSPVIPMSELVIQAVAEANECDPSMVSPPLYDAIDPDALDAIYRRASPAMLFEYADYRIEITTARTVHVHSK